MKRITMLLGALVVAACTDSGDGSPPVDEMKTVTGTVELGDAIQGALVYGDVNGNNQMDASDERVQTDASGHFSLTYRDSDTRHPMFISAIISATNTRVGVATDNTVGIGMHLRAPVADSVVISPLTTLVVSEMAGDATLTQESAAAKVAASLTASRMTFTGPIDVMEDYVVDTTSNGTSLRLVAEASGGVLAITIDEINGAQTVVDAFDSTYFDPIVAAVGTQLTAIANGTFNFSQANATIQMNIGSDPASYPSYFVDPAALKDAILSELEAFAIEVAGEFLDYVANVFIHEVEARLQAFLAGELIGLVQELII